MGDEPAGDDLHARRVLAEPHGHEGRIARELETLDLQVVFRVAEAEVAPLFRKAGIVGKFRQHARIEPRRVSRHPCLKLGAAAYGAVNEQSELDGTTPKGATAENCTPTPHGTRRQVPCRVHRCVQHGRASPAPTGFLASPVHGRRERLASLWPHQHRVQAAARGDDQSCGQHFRSRSAPAFARVVQGDGETNA